ncbi:MAG: FAD-dependent oxidoreductase [Clostridiales bacterium]|nr:FAD-dependent oxidoreductase [Clostridiales bacterium]
MSKKIVVIGSNHAGTAAIRTILSTDPGADVTVFDANSNISFLGCGMALWIGKQIGGSEGLFYSNREQLEKMGAKIHMETEVNKIDFKARKIFAAKDGAELIENYDKLILATGSLPIVPDIPGKDLQNVQLVKLYQHAQEVIQKLDDKSIQNVVVVGAGYIGVELAEAFQRTGRSVTVIDVGDTCIANYFDTPFTDSMNEVLRANGINLHYNERLLEIKGEGKVQSVKTDKGEYPADMVVLCIGFRPNNELGKNQLELFRNGAYLVNKRQETSVPDVYAIGDCATVYDNTIDSVNYIALATNAVRSGLVAAFNICGADIESIGVQGSNGICIYDYKMVSTGVTLAKAKALGIDAAYGEFEDYQKPGFIETANEKVKIRIVYDNASKRVLGAQIASKYDISMAIHMFSLAIQEHVTIDRLKLLDIFFLPHFNQPYNYITMAALSAK